MSERERGDKNEEEADKLDDRPFWRAAPRCTTCGPSGMIPRQLPVLSPDEGQRLFFRY